MDKFNLNKSTNADPFNLGNAKGIRLGVEDFIKKHPTWMVYIRTDSRYPSTVGSDPTTNSPDSTSQVNFGLGTKVQFEKHAVRRTVGASQLQSVMESFGYLAKYSTIVYTPRYYYPKQKDLYLEVEWDVEWQNIEIYGKPIKIINAYQVSESIAFKEDEVSYIASCCDIYNFDLPRLNEWLKSLGAVWVVKKVV